MKKARQYRGGYQSVGMTSFARGLRTEETLAEGKLWQFLRNRQFLGLKFRRQHQFRDYIADFYCREANLVIECDGSFHDSNERWHHDQNRDAYPVAQGLRVLRFTNEQVLNDTQSVLKEISNHLL
jgi:very-short-patch-repair endonuclease